MVNKKPRCGNKLISNYRKEGRDACEARQPIAHDGKYLNKFSKYEEN